MLNVLVLAVASAVSPAILAVVIVVLRRPNPRRLLAAYLLGGMLTSIVVGVVVVTSLQGLDLVAGPNPAANPILNFTVGGLALLVAFVLATDRDAPIERRRQQRHAGHTARDPWSQRVLSRGSASVAFAVGVALNLPGAFYLVALKDIAQGQHGTGAEIVAVVVFNLIMFALAEVPLLGYSFAPETTTEKVEALNAWMGERARQIVIVVSLLAAVYLIGRGVLDIA